MNILVSLAHDLFTSNVYCGGSYIKGQSTITYQTVVHSPVQAESTEWYNYYLLLTQIFSNKSSKGVVMR